MAEKAKEKRKRSLNPKQKKLVKALTTANSVAEAGRIAGYGTRESAHRALKNVKEKLPDLMERLGMTDEWLMKLVKSGAEGAMRVTTIVDRGIFMEDHESADHVLRFKYQEMTARIKGIGKYGQSDGANHGGDQQAALAQVSVRLVVTDDRRAAAISRLFAAGSSDNVVIDVDAKVDANVGRTGPSESA